MKNTLLILIIALFCSCQKEYGGNGTEPEASPKETVSDTSQVAFCFRHDLTDEVEVSRANYETDLFDVNIYIYNAGLGIAKHYYLTSPLSALNVKLINGNYDIYVIGNWGSDLGAMSKSELLNLRYTAESESEFTQSDRMKMSRYIPINLIRNSEISIPLQRLVSKVTFNVSMSPAMAADSKIVHIQPFSCNGSVALFADSRIINPGSPAIGYPVYDISALNTTTFSKSYYFMENAQGVNYSISDQRGRTAANAPTHSTYVSIRIERNRKFIDYLVYLGENNTTDFNLKRNTNYNYNIVIEGENVSDLRVSTTQILIYSGQPSAGSGSYTSFNKIVWNSRVAYCELNIQTANIEPDNVFNVSFYVISGTFAGNWNMEYMEKGAIPVQYLPIAQYQIVKCHQGNGKTVLYFAFWNGGSLTDHSVDNLFNITVRDKYGYSKSFLVQTAHMW